MTGFFNRERILSEVFRPGRVSGQSNMFETECDLRSKLPGALAVRR